jgi:hypothetical protein
MSKTLHKKSTNKTFFLASEKKGGKKATLL